MEEVKLERETIYEESVIQPGLKVMSNQRTERPHSPAHARLTRHPDSELSVREPYEGHQRMIWAFVASEENTSHQSKFWVFPLGEAHIFSP